MPENVIYHNPRCSKSRAAMAILSDHQADVKVVEYQQDPPSVADLKDICRKLKLGPVDIIRTRDVKFRALHVDDLASMSDDDIYQLIVDHPEILQRPIVCYHGKAVIARPAEQVLTII